MQRWRGKKSFLAIITKNKQTYCFHFFLPLGDIRDKPTKLISFFFSLVTKANRSDLKNNKNKLYKKDI